MSKATSRWVETTTDLMRILTLEKESTLEEIAEKTSKSYSTALRRVKELEKFGYIKLDRTESTSVGGKERKIYRITLKGLVFMSNSKILWDNIDIVAQNHEDLLQTFSKWNLFVKMGFRDLVVRRLKGGFLNEGRASITVRQLSRFFGFHTERTKEEVVIQTNIDSYVFGLPLLTFPGVSDEVEKEKEELKDFWRLSKSDPELSSWVSMQLERLRVLWERDLLAIKRGKEFWDSL